MTVADFIADHEQEMSTRLRNVLMRHQERELDSFHADGISEKIKGMGDGLLDEFEALRCGMPQESEADIKDELNQGFLP